MTMIAILPSFRYCLVIRQGDGKIRLSHYPIVPIYPPPISQFYDTAGGQAQRATHTTDIANYWGLLPRAVIWAVFVTAIPLYTGYPWGILVIVGAACVIGSVFRITFHSFPSLLAETRVCKLQQFGHWSKLSQSRRMLLLYILGLGDLDCWWICW